MQNAGYGTYNGVDLVEKYRRVGDKLADDTISSIYHHGGIDGVVQLLNEIIDLDKLNADPGGKHGPGYTSYLQESVRRPPSYDAAKIEASVDWFNDYGWTAFSILGCASLPEGYSVVEVTEVLGTTQAMETHTQRRLWETVQFVLDVMEPGALTTDPADPTRITGRAAWRIQKVRLFHATIRFLLQYDRSKLRSLASDTEPVPYGGTLIEYVWDEPRFGTPINQAQMTGTIYSFSWIVLRGLFRLGYQDRIPNDMAEAFLYRWNIVGELMGVLPELLVDTVAESEKLWDHLRRPNPSDTGKAIMASLVDFMEGQVPKYLFFLKPTARMLIVYLVGEEHARQAGLELTIMQKLWFRPMGWMMQAWSKLYGHSGAMQGASRWLYKQMRRNMIGKGRSGPRVFTMPDATPTKDTWVRGS